MNSIESILKKYEKIMHNDYYLNNSKKCATEKSITIDYD